MELKSFISFKIRKQSKKKKAWLSSIDKNTVLTKHTFEIIILSNYTMYRLLELSFTHMTKVQFIGIPLQICGFDLLCSARTGSGKTLAFSIPIIEFILTLGWKKENGLGAIILSPTRELTLQNYYILRDLLKYHEINVGILMGGANRKTETEKIKSGIVIVAATPGRLLDHLKLTKGFKINNLQILILDEADRCMEIGFEEEMIEIFKILPTNRQTIMLSATQTKNMKGLIDTSFKKKPVFFAVDNRKDFNIPSIKQGFSIINQDEKMGLLLAIIKKNKGGKIIVFFSSCNEVRFFSTVLKSIKLDIFDLHGKQKQYKRTSTFFSFCNSQRSILFCTDIAARGLDFPAVDWIIQFSPPTDPKEYVHRIGRTGRGIHGKGWSLLFILPSEMGLLKFLKKNRFILEEFRFPFKNFSFLNERIKNIINKNFFLKKMGKEAFSSFINSYKNHILRNIFDPKKLNIEKIYSCYGLKQFST
jgi:ATP-dependent RNA helicase DDX18/HAS1